MKLRLFIHFLLLLCAYGAGAQAPFKLSGHIYDSSRTYPLTAVSVMSTSGRGTVTDTTGHYSIMVTDRDSVWFSYLNKPTIKFPVAKIQDASRFDLALRVPVAVLKEVIVRQRSHKLDSLQNRQDYAKVFNFRKPSVETMTSIGPMGAGIDINELIRSFQFRRNRSMMQFQERLLQQERDKYIDHRFNKSVIRRLTGLTGEELDRFALIFRPTYEFVTIASDYDLQAYIKSRYQIYLQHKAM